MAANWTVIAQRQTTANTPGIGLHQVMEITFRTNTNHTGTVSIDLATYGNTEQVRKAIQDRVDQVEAVAAL